MLRVQRDLWQLILSTVLVELRVRLVVTVSRRDLPIYVVLNLDERIEHLVKEEEKVLSDEWSSVPVVLAIPTNRDYRDAYSET